MISRTLYLRCRLNMNSFDIVSFFFLLPRRNAGEIESPSHIVNPNLHLYRLHAINENIKSIFVRIKERKTRSRDTRHHVWRFIAMLWKNQLCKMTWRVVSRTHVRLAYLDNFTSPHITIHVYNSHYITFKTKFKAKIYSIVN